MTTCKQGVQQLRLEWTPAACGGQRARRWLDSRLVQRWLSSPPAPGGWQASAVGAARRLQLASTKCAHARPCSHTQPPTAPPPQVNPLAETDSGLVAADAKLGFDDNASFRQQELFDMRDESQEDPR